MNTPANTPAASAEALAAHFQVAELEPRLENDWLNITPPPALPGSGDGPNPA
jgi:hypothetical protein